MKALIMAFGVLFSGSALATPPASDGQHKIKICHATASGVNPYNIIDVDVAAWSSTPGVDSKGKPIKQSNHWGHQAEFGGKGDFWLEDETMSCSEFAAWLTTSTQRVSYLDQSRSLYVACNSKEAANGDRIPGITNFVDPNDGHIISVPCPDWHTVILAPSDKVQTTAGYINYYVTDTAGGFPSDFQFHTQFNPTPGTVTTITLDAAGGAFGFICPASGSIDVQGHRWTMFGTLVTTVSEQACTPGAVVMKNEMFAYGDDFAPVAMCPDDGHITACFTGNSGTFDVPAGLTPSHACFDTYSCFAGQEVNFASLTVLNSGFFEFPVTYLP